ncbi:guanine nucleotide binding protein, alpha subunit [Hysterangium stoloniferum]|nr:guanine nucleotide binding protein, alpha subunit [Hysterangium stoloniferum]
MPRRPPSPDPLVILPPPGETPQQRAERLQAEAEAIKISAAIDAELELDREAAKKRAAKQEVKVVLLGQAESGKSTLRKQFQLQWASRTLDAERATWRPIVTLNVIRGLGSLFEQLETAFDPGSSSPSHSAAPSIFRSDTEYPYSRASSPGSSAQEHNSLYSSLSLSRPLDPATAMARDQLFYYRDNLLALISLEDALTNSISGMVRAVGGVYIRADWQASHPRDRDVYGRSASTPPSLSAARKLDRRDVDIIQSVQMCLAQSREFIRDLWHHPYLPMLLKARRIKLEDSTAFFLSAVDRISQPDYLPTDGVYEVFPAYSPTEIAKADILHVRLQTLGVSEHVFDVNVGGRPVRWLIYDVGGARGLRHAWVPYFDDARAIIFLAPISAFDQYLDEDPRTNRIDDSLQIFSQICTNKLLRRAHLILLLNKTDLLRQKIEAGIKVKKFITSYGDRVNTYEEASQYFRAHFLQVHRKNDESKRTLFTHFTSVIDTKATKKIIYNVADSILKDHISATGLV